MYRWLRRDQRGFTLIEMMVVLAIIALIAVFAIPNLAQALQGGRLRTVEAQARQIQAAMEEYYHDYVAYPAPASPSYEAFFGSTGLLLEYISLPQSQANALFVFNCYSQTDSGTATPKYVMVITAKNVNLAANAFRITKDAVTQVVYSGNESTLCTP